MRVMYISRDHAEEFRVFMEHNGRVVPPLPKRPPPPTVPMGDYWKAAPDVRQARNDYILRLLKEDAERKRAGR